MDNIWIKRCNKDQYFSLLYIMQHRDKFEEMVINIIFVWYLIFENESMRKLV